MLVWTDLETTGLDPHHDIVLEVAIVITDDKLNVHGEFSSIVLNHVPLDRGVDMFAVSAGAKVWEGHKKNGLLDELWKAWMKIKDVDGSAFCMRRVEAEIAMFFDAHGVQGDNKPLLAGSTISFDRNFMQVQMPSTLKRLHYRNVDVSTISELAKVWRPDLSTPEKKEMHRALSDIHESIGLLRFYRQEWLT